MKKGFTLIELLVVIAIIAILAAILFPVFAQAREKARSSSCLSNTKQIGTALQLYVDDYDETVPLSINPTIYVAEWNMGNDTNHPGYPVNTFKFQECSSAYAGAIWSWCDEIFPYVKNINMFKCPSGIKHHCGYGYNMCLVGSQNDDTGAGTGYSKVIADGNAKSCTNQQPVSLSSVKNTSEVVFVGDTIQDKTNDYSVLNLEPYYINSGYVLNNPTKWLFAARHNEGLNFVMLDGHSKYYKRRAKGPCIQGNPYNGHGNRTRYWDPLYPEVDYDTWTVTW